MKVIFSRKGFDSASGGIPNPILPDGTLLSMPIPSPKDNIRYEELSWKGVSYYDIIRSLSPRTRIRPTSNCHLDPDLRRNILPRDKWLPAFGQIGSSLMHLYNQGVSVGDLFLFFGWYRQTEFHNGALRFVPTAPDLHIIYGYLQIGAIIKEKKDLPEELFAHPHAADFRWATNKNALFVPAETLSLDKSLPGYAFLPSQGANEGFGTCLCFSRTSPSRITGKRGEKKGSSQQEEDKSSFLNLPPKPWNGLRKS